MVRKGEVTPATAVAAGDKPPLDQLPDLRQEEPLGHPILRAEIPEDNPRTREVAFGVERPEESAGVDVLRLEKAHVDHESKLNTRRTDPYGTSAVLANHRSLGRV